MNILIAAVGGQGALLASRVLGSYAKALGHDIKVSEIHGMSQRGGSVVTHIRFGGEIHSPVIERGTADALLAFELLEAARLASHLRAGALLVANTQRILPLPVLTGAVSYPDGLDVALQRLPVRCCFVDAARRAIELGNAKAVNTLLIGVLARQLTSDRTPWLAAVEASVKAVHRAVNLASFDAGWNLDFDATGAVCQPSRE
jgi:indolepyruvate ferredoxin oxidoreductase, beta subunit